MQPRSPLSFAIIAVPALLIVGALWAVAIGTFDKPQTAHRRPPPVVVEGSRVVFDLEDAPEPEHVPFSHLDVCERAAWDLYPNPQHWGQRSEVVEGCRTNQQRREGK